MTPLCSPEDIAQRAIASVTRQPTWDHIEVNQAAAKDYSFTLSYKGIPADKAAVERDTKAIARAVLKALVAAGHEPIHEGIFVFVFALKPVKVETGAQMYVALGSTFYDWNHDELNFEHQLALQ
jgi:hypothetical protein